ncbi:MAG: 50S ribosomal protein L11 methyltransferase, partial [Opitutae bacterium]|nr:50S ribosomal protein L11 methyltransferase [Opitutae bacterium]
MAELFALYRQEPVRATHTLLADEDWATSWQQYFKPFAIVPGLVIKPSWEPYTPAAEERVIEMDPGMAFGTGQHASTRLALELITARLGQGPCARALDVGTGTGILAMAAALFGCREVLAVDNDPDAVAVARQNVAHNHLAARIELASTPVAEIRGSFQLIAANIVHDVLVDLAPDLTRLTAPGGSLVLAGILVGEQEAHIAGVYA